MYRCLKFALHLLKVFELDRNDHPVYFSGHPCQAGAYASFILRRKESSMASDLQDGATDFAWKVFGQSSGEFSHIHLSIRRYSLNNTISPSSSLFLLLEHLSIGSLSEFSYPSGA